MSSEQGGGAEKGLDWMYEGPNSLVNREDYLLGRKVDKSFQMLEAAEKGNSAWLSEAEKDLTPQSILKQSGPAGPIDVIRKIKDDPLYQIQKKEQEYRKQLLQNPILMKKLKEQHSREPSSSSSSKSKVKSKKQRKSKKHKSKRSHNISDSDSSSDEEVDKLLQQLKQSQGHDLSKLLSSSSSSKKKKSKRHDSSSDDEPYSSSSRRQTESQNYKSRVRSRSRSPPSHDRRRRYSPPSRRVESTSYRKVESSKMPAPPARTKLNEEEMERRRQEMMGNAKQRDEERTKVVEKHREELKKEQALLEEHRKQGKDAAFIRKQLVEAANTGSVEARIKSNSYNIQRSKFAMDKNFARR